MGRIGRILIFLFIFSLVEKSEGGNSSPPLSSCSPDGEKLADNDGTATAGCASSSAETIDTHEGGLDVHDDDDFDPESFDFDSLADGHGQHHDDVEDERHDDGHDDNEEIVTEFGPEDEQGSDIGIPQITDDMDHEIAIGKRIEEARKYVKDVVMVDEKYELVRSLCHNRNEHCAFWAVIGECANNPYMEENCAPVCRTCEKLHVDDPEGDEEEVVTKFGPEDKKGSDIGLPQKVDDVTFESDIAERIKQARLYVKDTVMVEEKYELVRPLCHNRNEYCAFWAVIGECADSPYMKENCAPVCETCEKLHVETRCPLDPNATDALYPGSLNKKFERIISDPEYIEKYQPTVLSRPSYPPFEGPQNTTYQLGLWLIQLENIATPEEATRLIGLGAEQGYIRSKDVGELKLDGSFADDINDDRTSTNAWCDDECYEDPVAREVMDRMANITGIPEPNQEYLQLLRYEKGQFYSTHNDYIEHDLLRQHGVRILTFFLYLSDVEEGGETQFPRIGLSVKPKTGRAVLWPSVFDEDPNRNDIRSDHQAMPVIKGLKYGANTWYHQRDFKGVEPECLS